MTRTELKRAAYHLSQAGRELRDCHTVNGKWAEQLDSIDRRAKKDSDEMLALAKKLSALARGMEGVR